MVLYGGINYFMFVVDAHTPNAFEFTKVYLEVFNLFWVIFYFTYLFFHNLNRKKEVIARQEKVSSARDKIFADIL